MKAVISRRDYPETVYDEFDDKPFATPSTSFNIEFIPTDDPSFYDLIDRAQPNISLEECEFDEEVRQGIAERTLSEWVLQKRSVHQKPMLELPFPLAN